MEMEVVWTCIMVLLMCSSGHARKNVLFLVSDDMRPELGCYLGKDYPSSVHPKMHTPNLDDLAGKSLLLKKAYVQQAICSPSRSSLLTGRRPDTTHVYDLYSYFREVGGNFTTIPQYFKSNGYQSIGIGKIFHPGPASDWDDPISWSEPSFDGVRNHEDLDHSWRAVPDDLLKDSPLIDQQVYSRAISTLRRVAQDDRPFFVAVGFHKPHLPFVFPASFLQYYPRDTIQLPPNPYAPVNMPEAAWFNFEYIRRFGDVKAYNVSGDINTTFPDPLTLDLRRAYYSATSFADSLIGGVIRELENLGLSNDTVISFFGDHGQHIGEHGEWTKQTNFELNTHAPMMLHIPGVTDAGIQTEQLAEFVDLFPTLVEAAGLPPLDLCPDDATNTALCREGTSLLPLIKNPDLAIKTAAFSQFPRNITLTGSTIQSVLMGYSVRTLTYRYTEWAEFDYAPLYKPHWKKLHGVELYDLSADPDENYNRAMDSSFQTIRSQLSTVLRNGWRKASHDMLSEGNALVG